MSQVLDWCSLYQADRTPDQVALEFGDESMTYRQLDARSNRLARYLRSHVGVGPDVLVGVSSTRGMEAIVSFAQSACSCLER